MSEGTGREPSSTNGNGRAKGLTAADLLGARRRAPEPVELPGLGTVYVKAISAGLRDRWEVIAGRERERARKDRGGERTVKIRSTLVAYCACDEDGKPLFSEDSAEQLADQDGGAEWIDRIFEAAAKLNRIQTGAEEEAEKNSGAARG